MELWLSLGDSSSLKPFVDTETHALNVPDLSFHMGLSLHPNSGDDHSSQVNIQDISTSPPLLTLGQANGSLEGGSRKAREFDVNRVLVSVAEEVSSANRTPRLFDSDSVMYRGNVENKRSLDDHADEEERGSKSRDSDDGKGFTRKKLRLSKQQSACLEESFEQHSALNPKQKHALAEQLNLRPRQVEVWFQNRRARTKLKQTEVDCECLKRCFETLTEENRILHKELQQLRALKSTTPFYMQSPATSLTMCSSCHDRVATSTSPSTTIATKPTAVPSLTPFPFPLSRSRFYHKSLMTNIKEKRR